MQRATLVLLVLLATACQAAVPVEDAYGPCEVDADCVDEARCDLDGGFNVCRPVCVDDADCPSPEGADVACRTNDDAVAECVIGPGRRGCPRGMVTIASAPSPTDPLICVWKP